MGNTKDFQMNYTLMNSFKADSLLCKLESKVAVCLCMCLSASKLMVRLNNISLLLEEMNCILPLSGVFSFICSFFPFEFLAIFFLFVSVRRAERVSKVNNRFYG